MKGPGHRIELAAGTSLSSVEGGRATLLSVHARPGARRGEIAGVHDGKLKVAVHAPADGGRANEELRALVAGLFGLRASAVVLVRGHSSRSKVLRVELPLDEVKRRLMEHLGRR